MADTENKALYIAEQCRKAGMTLAGAAGVIANVEAESAFISTNLQDCYNSSLGMSDDTYTARVDNGTYHGFTSDTAGYGLAQWTAGDRKSKMLAYHKQRGASIGDFRTQVDFLIYEMGSGYKKAWLTCAESNDPFECGYAVCKYYEIPADTENQANYRGGLARKWYDWMKAHSGEESTITDALQEPQQTDDDGIVIPQTWPPRQISADRCNGWPEVRLLQSILACRGYSVTHNGIFGESLSKTVKAFQRSKGLIIDGVVGDMTWAALGIKK